MNSLKKYFELKSKQKEIQAQLKELESEVFDEVVENGENNKLTTDFCRFQVVYRPKYEYSDELSEKIISLKTIIKLEQKKEEVTGVAKKISDNGQLRMTSLK